MFSCFGEHSHESAPVALSGSQIIAERANSLSLDIARSTSTTEDDDEFQLRLQGYDDSDPELKALREEKLKQKSQDMESKRRLQEEVLEEYLHRRLEGL